MLHDAPARCAAVELIRSVFAQAAHGGRKFGHGDAGAGGGSVALWEEDCRGSRVLEQLFPLPPDVERQALGDRKPFPSECLRWRQCLGKGNGPESIEGSGPAANGAGHRDAERPRLGHALEAASAEVSKRRSRA